MLNFAIWNERCEVHNLIQNSTWMFFFYGTECHSSNDEVSYMKQRRTKKFWLLRFSHHQERYQQHNCNDDPELAEHKEQGLPVMVIKPEIK